MHQLYAAVVVVVIAFESFAVALYTVLGGQLKTVSDHYQMHLLAYYLIAVASFGLQIDDY